MDRERARVEFPALDPQESDTETKPEEPHWVAELFRPHFTVLDLLEGSDGRPRLQEPSSPLQVASEKENEERSRRVQEIYRSALREVQLRESVQRRERLSKMTVREGESEETDPKRAGHKGMVPGQSEDEEGGKEEEEEGERCIWNERDLSALRRAVREVELDRRRLRAELRLARAEAGEQREERRRLQGLLDEREEQLGRAKRAAAQCKLRLDALRAEARGREARLERQAAEARDRAQEAQRAAAGTRKAEEEAWEARRENAGLVRELERLRGQREEEDRRQAEVARVEREAALQGLQRELQAVRAELEAERQSHARSHTALELLRRHFTGHPPRETRESSADRISYI
ncbi:coiled-coil domain-containing protein 160 homolog [Anguilla anguilla]|uniref:coiled-coil domain-containing protein 160 homolog n=1 Tax=Anguilla anguilla TaxID=7936 RepID=UPI0015B00189|nr:coiled-coil domain-containing protein 160 homolog [Anguilla anguilla]